MPARHPLQPKDWTSGTHADRFARIRRYVEHRRVLDIGAGSGINRPDWMHALIAAVAGEAVGIELDEELATRARALGFDVIAADAQTMDLGRTFEVVWAGEVIEHLSCVGRFPRRGAPTPRARRPARAHDAERLHRLELVYRIGGSPRINKGHTCWFDEVTLSQLLQRHAFEIVEVGYVGHRTPGLLRGALALTVRWLLPRHLAENTLLVVATAAITEPGTGPISGHSRG